jgi:hypothetical protein
MSLLFRADFFLYSRKVMQEIHAQAKAPNRPIAFIIKWNPPQHVGGDCFSELGIMTLPRQ